MSRAFVKDDDEAFEELPERPISAAPNWVTEEGLAAIEAEIGSLTGALTTAGDDRYERARIGRDLRYWAARRAGAHVAPNPTDTTNIQFGATVTRDRGDGRRDVYRIVGEDEADPSKGTISYVAPLARALIGKNAGDVITLNGVEIEIVRIDFG